MKAPRLGRTLIALGAVVGSLLALSVPLYADAAHLISLKCGGSSGYGDLLVDYDHSTVTHKYLDGSSYDNSATITAETITWTETGAQVFEFTLNRNTGLLKNQISDHVGGPAHTLTEECIVQHRDQEPF